MLRVFTIAICLASLLADKADAVQKYPYQAIVVGDRVEIRCGPGTNYYVTSYAKQQQTITVYRHDHGGWFMIAPPKGSFSWVEADLIQKNGPDHGVVRIEPENGKLPRAMVRIGSEVTDEHSFYGRELSNGDEVTILGEKAMPSTNGVIRMYKIVPPQQEFRWIKGEFVAPVDESTRQRFAQDPYQIPPEYRAAAATKRSQQQAIQAEIAKREAAQKKAQYDQLDSIDKTYTAMMDQQPAHWDLDRVESQYRQLAQTSDSTISALVDKRLDVIKRRRELLAHYRDFVQVSAETSQRDQALVARQLGYEQSPTNSLAAQNSVMTSEPESLHPRLNGAGIIRPTGNGFGRPPFALVAPTGQLLAYLDIAPTVPIRQWVNKPSGIIGERSFDQQLGADLIKVQRVVPIRLLK